STQTWSIRRVFSQYLEVCIDYASAGRERQDQGTRSQPRDHIILLNKPVKPQADRISNGIQSVDDGKACQLRKNSRSSVQLTKYDLDLLDRAAQVVQYSNGAAQQGPNGQWPMLEKLARYFEGENSRVGTLPPAP